MTNTPYTIPTLEPVLTDGFVPFAWVLNDRPALDTPAERRKYFDRGYRLFHEKLASFGEDPAAPTLREERELIFMLQALIEAKRRMDTTS